MLFRSTHFEVKQRRGPLALVEARLETGRTHQVRIHADAWGSPILGDSKYGRGRLRSVLRDAGLAPAPRLLLHAHRLRLPGQEGETVEYTSKLPDDITAYFESAGPSL